MTNPLIPQEGARSRVPAHDASNFAPPAPPVPRVPTYRPVAIEREEEVHLRDYLVVLYRRRWWGLAVFALVLGLAGWLTYRATPIFEAQTTIRIESPESETPILSDLASLQKGNPIGTEIQMLRSRSLAEEVVRELGLNVSLIEPDKRRSDVIDSVSVRPDVEPGQYSLGYEDGSWTVSRNGRLLARAADGLPLEFSGLRVEPRPARGAGGATVVLGVGRVRDGVGSFLGQLDVSVPVRDANVVRVTYRDPDPAVAKAAVDAVAAKFIAKSFLANKSQARSTREFLQAQLAQLAEELKRHEDELQAYKEKAQVVALSTEAEQGIQSFARFEAERNHYVAERNALVSIMRGRGAPGAGPRSDLSTFPSFIENESIQQLKSQENELESLKNKLLTEKTRAHPDVVAVQQQIDQVRADLEEAAHGYRTALESKIRALDRTLAGFQVQFRELPEKEVNLARLLRAQKVAEELYTNLQMKFKEAQIAEAVELASIRVIDPAVTPESPIKPNRRLNLSLAMLVGLVLGCGAAFAREYFDNSLRTKEHVERDLRLPILGVIPVLEPNGRRALLPKSTSARSPQSPPGSPAAETAEAASPAEQKPLPGSVAGPGRLLLPQLPPHSAAVEAFRMLRVNLAFLPLDGTQRAHRVTLVTSPGSAEGKTLIAANLAICFAQQGSRTVLLDADLRESSQHELFGVARRKGLTDYLAGRANLREIVRETSVRKLYLIPAGASPPLPVELLGSPRMDRLLGALAACTDVLIIDSPPVLPVADAVVLSAKADDVLLVIRSGRTDRSAASDALALLADERAGRVTCILNGMDYRQAYGFGYYGRYYESYYSGAPEELEPDWDWNQTEQEGDREPSRT